MMSEFCTTQASKDHRGGLLKIAKLSSEWKFAYIIRNGYCYMNELSYS
jgi:hypothetical protein